jgi:molybdopterin-guanine dinucleotide biosynthesis protein A
MDAIVLAGGTPGPGDLLYSQAHGKPKAMIDIAGKPMAQWVLDAIGGSSTITHVFLIGLPEDCGLTSQKPVDFVPDQGDMVANVKAGMHRASQLHPHDTHALLASGDIPGITTEIVDWRAREILEAQADLDYAVVERSVMEKRYPGSRRSYTRLKDVEVCGGDLNGVRVTLGADEPIWQKLVAARKNALKQAALVGWDILFLTLTRQLTLADGERRVSQHLQLKGHACLTPYAEVGMDVDKPFQLEIMRQDMAARKHATV